MGRNILIFVNIHCTYIIIPTAYNIQLLTLMSGIYKDVFKWAYLVEIYAPSMEDMHNNILKAACVGLYRLQGYLSLE